jgi:hypothetical protein
VIEQIGEVATASSLLRLGERDVGAQFPAFDESGLSENIQPAISA